MRFGNANDAGDEMAQRLGGAPALMVGEAFDLKPGDNIEIHNAGDRTFAVESPPARELLKGLRNYRRRLPAGFNVARLDVNERGCFSPWYCTCCRRTRRKRIRRKRTVGDVGMLSVQALNAFAAVALRKLQMSWSEFRNVLAPIRMAAPSC
jgi:antitoxin MazE